MIVKSYKACLLLPLLLLVSCAGLLGPKEPRQVGQFDPGQNGIPAVEVVSGLCGGSLVSALYSVSNAHADVAWAWERYRIYIEGIQDSGVTKDERTGAETRYTALVEYLVTYETAMDTARITGSAVSGEFATRCDTEVLLIAEKRYQDYNPTIKALKADSLKLLHSVGGKVQLSP
jgi:hypothetical protein